ncbi:von Willebrand factor A domain-containing protein 5A-like isoform X2 [Centropristis striata]|uniref:von Willebrand factor A domain-containing protein 5A-like isoform X2 n=1 Tax=Centropristis striata TaxID=184440 RepID=UPI0027E0DC50|nr:von Willebrand factor A domain-containing protein 5A-like isoform X2 [Centropristis striata]
MAGSDRGVLQRLTSSQLRMGRGSPLCEELREQIVQQFKNNVSQRTIARNLGISTSTIHNIIKRFKESGDICARKGQGRKPTLDASELQSLRQHCITNRHDSIKDITTWAREHFGKPLSVNTVRRCIDKCKLRLEHARRKPSCKHFSEPTVDGTKINCCGLLSVQKGQVPLKSVEVEVEVRDHVATVVSTLNYENKEDKPLEAVFVFPLPGDAAVCHFSAKIGQTEIVAEVKEKQEAREEYDDALSSGRQAFLLEESDQSPDIFSMSVGSLPPGESASIRLEYVTELAVQADEGLRFCLPAVLNPRYQPRGSEGNPVQVTSVPASLVPYSLSFSARVSSARPVSKVESNCPLDPLQYLNTEQTQATVKLSAGHKFDRDVELLIYYKDAHQPTAVVEAGQASAKPGTLMGDPVVMLSLYPEFPQAVMSSVTSCGEFVFLLDRSGSMGSPMSNNGSPDRIFSARDTLLLLLKSLPMGCYFNIFSFGSSYEHVFPKSVEYSQQTMEEALKKVEEMEADLGGTEILEPLKHIYSQSCIPSQPRQMHRAVWGDGRLRSCRPPYLWRESSAGSLCPLESPGRSLDPGERMEKRE